MKKTLLVAVLVVAALGFMAPRKAEACFQCKWKLRCVADFCELLEYCQGQSWGKPAMADCDVDFYGTCKTGNEFCVWTLNLTPVEIRPDLACHEASS